MVQISRGIFFRYWWWYFIAQPKTILKAWRNFLVFGFNFFSLPLLVRTLFTPWHRYYVSYGRGFDIKIWLEAVSSNLIFRILGAIIRLLIIALGIIFEAAVLLIGLLIFTGWLVLPFALFFLFIFAFKLLVL